MVGPKCGLIPSLRRLLRRVPIMCLLLLTATQTVSTFPIAPAKVLKSGNKTAEKAKRGFPIESLRSAKTSLENGWPSLHCRRHRRRQEEQKYLRPRGVPKCRFQSPCLRKKGMRDAGLLNTVGPCERLLCIA